MLTDCEATVTPPPTGKTPNMGEGVITIEVSAGIFAAALAVKVGGTGIASRTAAVASGSRSPKPH